MQFHVLNLQSRTARWLAALTTLVVSLTIGSAAFAHVGDVIHSNNLAGRYTPGEIHRFNAHVYDHYYRSPNVFRDSAHAHPTRNVYRSSRSYQNTLSYTNDARYVRTFYHNGRNGHRNNGRPFCDDDSYTYSRACGTINPVIVSPVAWTDFYAAPYGYGEPYADPGVITRRNPRIEQQIADGTYQPPSPIEMIVLTPPRVPTQTAVMEQVTLPDGRVKTVITSVPIGMDRDAQNSASSPTGGQAQAGHATGRLSS